MAAVENFMIQYSKTPLIANFWFTPRGLIISFNDLGPSMNLVDCAIFFLPAVYWGNQPLPTLCCALNLSFVLHHAQLLLMQHRIERHSGFLSHSTIPRSLFYTVRSLMKIFSQPSFGFLIAVFKSQGPAAFNTLPSLVCTKITCIRPSCSLMATLKQLIYLLPSWLCPHHVQFVLNPLLVTFI